VPPPFGSADQSSDQAVPLADCCGDDEPQIPLAIIGTGGTQDAVTLQINHNGVNGALVAAGIHSHSPHDVGAGLGSLLDQGGADCGAGQSGEVHWSGVVN
jgi:hypothetical protein